MKNILLILLCVLLLTGCGSNTITGIAQAPSAPTETAVTPVPDRNVAAAEYSSRFETVTEICLTDAGITVDGGGETETVFTSHDIIYYEDRDAYESGNPYGEGTDADKHPVAQAAAHTVVNITSPGAYRMTGRLAAGQIRVDLGEEAYEDPNAVVELILSDADITCSVAPAILFLNTYECDGSWSEETAKPDVDTGMAGANLILEGSNTVSGAYVARIYQDREGQKKLWKQDGAIYSYMSMNVLGSGSLDLTASNEGLDTELHLTIHSGDILIKSDNDGINTNEDNVSVTTINGGNLTIFAGLGAEGDGIDSNGYLVINGGTVIASAHPAADAGLDSDLGSFVHGGSVTALGSAMDWAESNSGQVTMNLQFVARQAAGSTITVTREDGSEVCTFQLEGDYARPYNGLILSRPELTQGETYQVCVDGVPMAYTSTDTLYGPGGHGHDFDSENMPENFDPDDLPGDFDPAQMGGRGPRPEGFDGAAPPMPQGMEPPEKPEGDGPEFLEGSFGGRGPGGMPTMDSMGDPRTDFYMHDMVNFFSGVMPA